VTRRPSYERRWRSIRYIHELFWDWDRYDLVTTAEAASLCRVKQATIRQWVHRGYLGSRGRRGRAHLYAVGDLQRAMEQVEEHKQPPPDLDVGLAAKDFDSLITASQAAVLFGVAPSTIRMWLARGHLKPTEATSRPQLFTAVDVLRAARRPRR
jgi:DNA-binding transcriptional MerR regulator